MQQQQKKHKEKQEKEEQVEQLVDDSMINLLRACSMLKLPELTDLQSRFVNFGPKTRQKVLILDMDETLLHSKFYPNLPGREI